MIRDIIFVIIVVISIITFFGSLYHIASFMDWFAQIDITAPQITFNAFKKLYTISPSKWEFCDRYVRYGHDYMIVEFKHYIDVIKYLQFKNKIEKDKQFLEKAQNEKELIKSVQNDIDLYREEYLSGLKQIINENNESITINS